LIRNIHFAAAAAAAMVAGLSLAPANAQSEIDFFDGKTIEYVVATDAGGGYDSYGRLVSEFMQKYLPGSTMIVRNLPGAGHVIGTNAIYNAEPNGLTMGTFNTGLIYQQLVGASGVKFDLANMSWIGKAATDPRVLVVSTSSGIETFEQLLAAKEEIRFGTGGIGSSDYVDMMMLTRALELPIKIIDGYNGNDNQLAMMRGEIHGIIASRSSAERFVNEGHGRLLVQIGGTQTDVPQLGDLVTSEIGQQVIGLIASNGTIGRLTAAPPGIDPARLDVLRDAYRQATSDPELLERAKTMGIPIDPLIGDEVTPLIQAQFELSPETLALVKELLAK
jgi:tripartite-type tricarboxylate transporter receptor subunit TctC